MATTLPRVVLSLFVATSVSAQTASWPASYARVWTVAVGEGYSSPVLSGTRVFVHGRKDPQEVVTAINATTGTVVWQQTGFVMVIYLAGLASVPVEIEEAAALDGANIWQRFWNVTVPAIRPSIAIATTLGIIQGLRIFDQIFALTGGGPAGATETLATQVYKQAFSLGQFGFGSALALVLTLIILVFAILQQFATRDRDAVGRA